MGADDPEAGEASGEPETDQLAVAAAQVAAPATDGMLGLRGRTRHAVERMAPPGSSTRSVLRLARQVARDGVRYGDRLRRGWAAARAMEGAEPGYRRWLQSQRPTVDALVLQSDSAVGERIRTHVEIVVLGGDRGDLGSTLDSLAAQTFRGWTATVVGASAGRSDERVRSLTEVGAAEAMVAVASDGDPNDLVVVVEAGDRLEPDFAFTVAARAWDNPFAALLGWDDDAEEAPRLVGDPRFRPGWSPDILLSANYLGRAFAVRRGRLAAAGGLRLDDGDAAWWDLLFRLDLDESEVVRIPRVLHHLVRRPTVAPERAVEAVRTHLARTRQAGEVSATAAGTRVRWALPDPPHVTIVIPTRHNREMLSVCLPSLAKTDYPHFDVRIVDNGGRTPENEAWWETAGAGLDLDVSWWDEPFNYSAVNNRTAAGARGEVLVFLNDDTELVDPDWLSEMVSWVRQPGIGLVGAQLVGPDGAIQHGGVVLGMHGFADHLLAGLRPGDDSLIGSSLWYRDCLSVTAACVAVDASLFAEVGGFDERFRLCGSDVVLGLDARFRGLRNVVTPFAGVRHLESATRGASTVAEDFFPSYWRYQKWLRGGDPYYSPSLSLRSTVPQLRREKEPPPIEAVGDALGRDFRVFRQRADEAESLWLANLCRADERVRPSVEAQHRADRAPFPVRTVNWFVPDIDSPFYGGINTAFRLAAHLARTEGVQNRFVVMAAPNEPFIRSALAAAFPDLGDSPIEFYEGGVNGLDAVSRADVSIATLWVTAYSVARFARTRRKFYLIQDFEPMFYPAGTNYALAEESYRLGLYGLCNTERLLDIYRRDYGGSGASFMPAVDPNVFHAQDRRPLEHDGPVTLFLYARPGHWRNCWELASLALDQVKERLGDRVRIVTAGSWARPDELGRGIEHLGLLDYRDTGALYRTCDAGIALTLSAHPSYLPLELMACGTPVVAFDNPAGDWILHHEQNSLRCPRTVDGLADALERIAVDGPLRRRLGEAALADIAARHSDWDAAFAGVYRFLCDPELGVNGT
jgi:GT2 family glycosyltransferase/glycosyltransferase involved in cell wall biosynthesis